MRAIQFGDYTFVIRPATTEEVNSWKVTAQSMGWQIPMDFSESTFGQFVSESGNVMDLPFELRATYMRVNGSTLDMAQYAIDELSERVESDINLAAVRKVLSVWDVHTNDYFDDLV